MASNLPEWEQLINALVIGVSAAATYRLVEGLLAWRRQRKANRRG